MGVPETASGAQARSEEGSASAATFPSSGNPGEVSGSGRSPPPPEPGAQGNLAIRLATAGTLGPLLLALLFYGPPWGWALLITASSAQVAREFLTMTHPEDRVGRTVGALVTAAVTGGLYWGVGHGDLRLSLLAFSVPLLVMPGISLLRLGDLQSSALRLLGGLSAPLYVGVPFACLALLRLAPEGRAFVLLTLTIAWMGDTGGYTFGRLFGRTKLYPQVSPKKTWEGLLGSVVFSTGAAVAAVLTYLPSLPLLDGVVLGAVGALCGQAGDLVESLLKRSTGVKDSGAILPGHGGLFDRVDALLVVALLVYVYLQF